MVPERNHSQLKLSVLIGHKTASAVCEVESQSKKCSRMLVKIRQTTL